MHLGCVTSPTGPSELNLISANEYEATIDKWTRHESIYSGLYNLLEVYVTYNSGKVLFSQLDQNARMYQWDKSKYLENKAATEKNYNRETEVFVSLYTPERKNNDLQKNKTLWKVFLDANGRRYEGVATKVKSVPGEVQGLYPYYNRFFVPYSVKFPVSALSLEGKKVRFTMTGPVGSISMNFLESEESK